MLIPRPSILERLWQAQIARTAVAAPAPVGGLTGKAQRRAANKRAKASRKRNRA